MPAEVLALVPARGGSKSLPRKNVLLLAGKPLIVHTLEQARAARHVTRIVVSTDDPEIAGIARDAGVEVPFLRPDEFARDDSPDIDAFRHALLWLREHEQYEPDLVVHLRPTHPIRRVERIDEAVQRMLADPLADSLRSVTWPDQTPYKMWRAAGRYLEPLLTPEGIVEAHSRPRQELPEVWWQNGYVDVIRPRTILDQGSMAGSRVLPYFVLSEPGVEIDHEQDLRYAEELLKDPAERSIELRHPR